MALQNVGARDIAPTHPGEMLREDFLPDYRLTRTGLARALGVSRQSINELLNEKRSLSPLMALRLARLFGNSAQFWLEAQQRHDLWHVGQAHAGELEAIEALARA